MLMLNSRRFRTVFFVCFAVVLVAALILFDYGLSASKNRPMLLVSLFTGEIKEYDGIAVDTPLTYYVGDAFGGGEVQYYSDGVIVKREPLTQTMTEGFTTAASGEYTATVSYYNLSVSYSYSVTERGLPTAIEVSSPTSNYRVGASLVSGITAVVTDNVGQQKTIPVTAEMVSDFSTAETGDFTAVISYEYKGVTVSCNYGYTVYNIHCIGTLNFDVWSPVSAGLSSNDFKTMELYSFTPSETAVFKFSSRDGEYVIGTIFDYNGKALFSAAYNADNGLDFELTCELETGKTYYLGCAVTTDQSFYVTVGR